MDFITVTKAYKGKSIVPKYFGFEVDGFEGVFVIKAYAAGDVSGYETAGTTHYLNKTTAIRKYALEPIENSPQGLEAQLDDEIKFTYNDEHEHETIDIVD